MPIPWNYFKNPESKSKSRQRNKAGKLKRKTNFFSEFNWGEVHGDNFTSAVVSHVEKLLAHREGRGQHTVIDESLRYVLVEESLPLPPWPNTEGPVSPPPCPVQWVADIQTTPDGIPELARPPCPRLKWEGGSSVGRSSFRPSLLRASGILESGVGRGTAAIRPVKRRHMPLLWPLIMATLINHMEYAQQ